METISFETAKWRLRHGKRAFVVYAGRNVPHYFGNGIEAGEFAESSTTDPKFPNQVLDLETGEYADWDTETGE